MPIIEKQNICRSCGGNLIGPILDLGNQPLANRLLKRHQLDDAEPCFPLCLMLCSKCKLLQLDHTVCPDTLFSDYLYRSSISNAFLSHASDAAKLYVGKYQLGKKNFIVEIASNDGYFLKNILRIGIPCLGIEPAKNIAKNAIEHGVPTLCDYFSRKTSENVVSEYGVSDLIVANNVFAHVPDINGFVQGVSILLASTGHAVFEFPWAQSMIKNLEFDTIYHEHIFYFHVHALVPLLERYGLEMVCIEKIPIHGGSLRVHIAHTGFRTPEPSVGNILAEEKCGGYETLDYYQKFGLCSHRIKDKIIDEIKSIKHTGSQIAAYGASAKGSTLLNFCGIDNATIEFVVDQNPFKQGMYTPGTKIPILPVSELNEKMPQVTMLLTWNFAKEVLSQQYAYTQRGGKFLIPIPSLHYLP